MSSVLAAQLYTVREFTQSADELAVALKKIREIGYTAVQISGIGPIPDAVVKSLLDDVGLTVCITHVREAWPWKKLDSIIAQHHLWNCKHVAIGSLPQEYRASEEGFLRFAAEANEMGKVLSQAGLTFSYHNHSFEFVRFGKRTALDLLFQETDPRYLKAELDTYWIQHGGGDPARWIKKMTGRMPVVHLKDMVMLDGAQAMAEVGEGNLNWPAILQACGEAGVEWYAVEQDECRRDPFESLRISYENLKAMGVQFSNP
jgi:sugar phosphate isomerase/epimerase